MTDGFEHFKKLGNAFERDGIIGLLKNIPIKHNTNAILQKSYMHKKKILRLLLF